MLARSLLFLSMLFSLTSFAMDTLPDAPMAKLENPLITPPPPSLNAKAWLLIDANSGKIIAGKNESEKLPPASLTKMMTLYVISKALKTGQLHLTDKVHVSHEAWKAEGSRMFVKEGDEVTVEDLLKGIIVDSGNDACTAMAEHLGGSEQGFAGIMNQEAQNLNMKNSHFTDSTGLPNSELYTTAEDLALLGRALVNDFPEYYHWYRQKWFEYNGIRQPNRNRLLWRNGQVDGIKTGHTNEAGFCLVASAKRGNMRLISIVMGSPSDNIRADDSERLLNYGFRFYETHALYKADDVVTSIPVYKGESSSLKAGLLKAQYITIPSGQYQNLHLSTHTAKDLTAPLKARDKVGSLVIELNGKPLETYPLYAMHDVPLGGFWHRFADSVRLFFSGWWNA